MSDRSEWILERTEAVGPTGMCAAKTSPTAEAGAEVLRKGGNAVDAAVVAGLVAWVTEPWMNGIGGGGYMVIHRPGDDAVVVEFPMVAPKGATPEMFPLAGTGPDTGLFGWANVVDNANIVGHKSVAVPGAVAGLALALEAYGTLSWADALEPAIRYADEGFPVSWHTTLTIARDLATLSKYPATRAVFCTPAGFPPTTLDQHKPTMLKQPDLANTLRTIQKEGPRSFYEGSLAKAMVAHLAEGGAPFAEVDYRDYTPQIKPVVRAKYNGYEIVTMGGGTGGTTLAQSMMLLDGMGLADMPHNSPEALHLMAQAFRIAFADRFAYLADPTRVEVPWERMLAADYLAERRADMLRDRIGNLSATAPERLGMRTESGSRPDSTSGGSTTHLSTMDKDGMSVALTQTLLSLWGSRVTVPGTGILMNNGMMWFDPEPGKANSVEGGGKQPLSNMSPAILVKDGKAVGSLGASGGRKIMNAVAQIAMNTIDHGMTMQPAVSAPRIDASVAELLVSSRIDEATQERLKALGHPVSIQKESMFLGEFASPACIGIAADGTRRAGVDPFYQPASAKGV